MASSLKALRRAIRERLEFAGESILLGGEAILWTRTFGRQYSSVIHQLYICAFRSLPVVAIVGGFTGMVLALQTGNALKGFGQEDLIGGLAAVALAREMGPNMTAFILAGLVGSAMAAELGTMKVSEEVDALEVMSINPIRYLVMPRVFALSIAAPLLTIYNDALGYFLGGVVGNTQLAVDWDAYIAGARDFLDNRDVYSGLFKAWIFGIVIATVSCSHGLSARGGALGVGRATRTAVVQSMLSVIVLNYFLTSIFARFVYY